MMQATRKKWNYLYAFLKYYERFLSDSLEECLKEGDETQILAQTTNAALETVLYLKRVMVSVAKMTDEEVDRLFEDLREREG